MGGEWVRSKEKGRRVQGVVGRRRRIDVSNA